MSRRASTGRHPDTAGTTPPALSPSTRLRRHPERSVAAHEDRSAILAAGLVAHVGVVVDGHPVVIPLIYHHEEGIIYLHGSRISRVMRHLATGVPACVTVTIVDGLIASRSAFNHSANYRSVVLFGHGAVVTDPARKRAVLERMTLRYFPGRTAVRDYVPATANELAVTTMIALTIDEMSGKRRQGPPLGRLDELADHPLWNGIVPVPGGTVPSPDS